MKPTTLLLQAMIFTLLFGCANPLKVDIVSMIPEGEVKTLVLLNDNNFSTLVRRSLIKNGFQVKAQSSVYNITQKSEELDVSYNNAEAQFRIRHSGRLSSNNPCMTNGNASHFTEYEFELIDIKTNDTIMFVSKGGWTEWCTGAPTTDTTDLFGDLSRELAKALKNNG